ncbi:uncharacterized protein [Clytia hemisphaerica]|uniref:uncharacterized protein n=1 Tax=Clytia hemisphaerica TaxID=252671 RepID=UPI0034D4C48B
MKIVKYACDGCPVRFKAFVDNVEKVSLNTTSTVWYNVSCFAPWFNDDIDKTTDLKYTSNPPLFRGEQSFKPTTLLATLPSWPNANTPFHVSFKIKIVAWLNNWHPIINFHNNDGAETRLPTFFFTAYRIVGSYKTGAANFNNIGIVPTSDITLNEFHEVRLEQTIDANGVGFIRFYFNNQQFGSAERNYNQATPFTDVHVKIHYSNGFDFVIKEFDYSGSD